MTRRPRLTKKKRSRLTKKIRQKLLRLPTKSKEEMLAELLAKSPKRTYELHIRSKDKSAITVTRVRLKNQKDLAKYLVLKYGKQVASRIKFENVPKSKK